jgi:hypothetical protein
MAEIAAMMQTAPLSDELLVISSFALTPYEVTIGHLTYPGERH